MRYNLYLLQFNNYYNRQLKKLSTLEEYLEYEVASIMDCNIDIKDAINTKIIINYKEELSTPNYLILEDKVLNKTTKWFVIECTMTRGLQYSLTIRRDVIADYFDTIIKSPCIIQKGYVDNNNVLVFNQENQNYNKRKTKELLIKDNTGIGYVVGFIARDAAGSSSNKIYASYEGDIQVDFDYDSLSNQWKNYFAIGNATPNSVVLDRTMTSIIIDSVGTQIECDYANGVRYLQNDGKMVLYKDYTNEDYSVTVTSSKQTLTNHILVDGYYETTYPQVPSTTWARDVVFKNLYESYSSITRSKLNNRNVDYRTVLNVDKTTLSYIQSFNNKICKINDVYYKAEIKSNFARTGSKVNDNYSFTANVRQSLPNDTDLLSIDRFQNLTIDANDLTSSDITLNYNEYEVYIKLVQQSTDVYTYLSPRSDRNHLIDNPYDMLVIPYSDDYEYEVNAQTYTANKNMAINLAQALCEASGSATYDIQIVPYCPFPVENNDWSLFNYQSIHIASDDSIIGYYFWANKSSITFKIEETREELTLSNDPSYKEITQLNKYILCSPDKNAQWEFNPAMNMGITEWNVSLDYRPFSSYVKVQPTWNYLYGESVYNNITDYRGLIFNGSYSLTQLNDAWANYLNGNKNYQQIFDTNINTELTKFNMNQAAQWDTVGLRNYSFNPVKAVLGIIGEDKQMEFDKKVFDVDLAAQRKLFDYQLDNIQNQPDTIKKLTSINIDFRIFPFVEIYEPTEQEQLIFRDNIRYNGMTIMATGYIENYLKPNDETFIKATLIRFNEFEALENDYTLVQNINFELDKGIYITKEE